VYFATFFKTKIWFFASKTDEDQRKVLQSGHLDEDENWVTRNRPAKFVVITQVTGYCICSTQDAAGENENESDDGALYPTQLRNQL
jgi:hypothetical protein